MIDIAVRDRPLICTGESVRSIFAGRKTKTRRVAKDARGNIVPGSVEIVMREAPNGEVYPYAEWPHEFGSSRMLDWYARPGDRLWVREAWRLARVNGRLGDGFEFATIQFREGYGALPYRRDWKEHYAALLAAEPKWEPSETGNLWGRWRPSIFMPRWASRLTLEIESVKVERLQDITAAGIRAEGIEGDARMSEVTLRDRFARGWTAINGKRKGVAWADNPWVWVISFKVIPQ